MLVYTIASILLFLFTIKPCDSQTRANVESLTTAMLTNYDKDIRPNDDQSQPTNMTFAMELYNIVQTDEKTGLFSITVAVVSKWNDPRVVWTPSSYGNITKLKMPVSKMWRPIYSFAPAVEQFSQFGSDNFKTYYSHQGDAEQSISDLVEIYCEYNIVKYPFDSQTCVFYIFPIGYNGEDIIFNTGSDAINLASYAEHGEWEIKSITTTSHSSQYFTAVVITVEISRRWQFFLLIYLTPILFLLLLNSMVFLLPPESGERVGYAITCLLSIAVFLTEISNTLPESSKNMSSMSAYLIAMLAFSTIFCIATIVSLIVYHKKDAEKAVPIWLKKLTFSIKTKSCKCNKHRRNDLQILPVNPDHLDAHSKNHDVAVESAKVGFNDIFNKTYKDIEWKDVGQLLDKAFFIVSLLFTAIASLAFLVNISS